MISLQKISIFLSLLFGGLIAGLLFGYSCSVNLGLKTLADNEYIKAMQSINVAIQNPLFLIPYMGLCIIMPMATFLHYRQQPDTIFYLMLTSTTIYIIGVFGITMFCNVPLNEQLARFLLQTASTNEIVAMRQTFEKSWNNYHTIRTVASIISFALTILSLIKNK